MRQKLFLLGLLLFLTAGSCRAVLVGYWDMDAPTVLGKRSANGGSQAGSISGSFVDISAGFFSRIDADIPGTAINLSGSEGDPNRAVGFYRVGTSYESGYFLMEDFDFSDMNEVTLSFAYNSQAAFTWNSNLHVDYRIDDGGWDVFDEQTIWTAGFALAEIDLPSAVDGQGNVDLRIRTVNWGSAIGYLDIDNVQVSAVPEASTFSYVLGIGSLFFVFGARRRRGRR